LGAVIARSAARLGLVALAALAGCGEPTSTVVAVLAVTTATAGPSPDPDGYVVRIDGTLLRRARDGDTVVVLLADGGTHAVALGEVSANCVVTGDSVRATPVPQADTAWVHFEVTCRATTGALRITTVATGQELDPNGYQLSITGADQPVTLDPNGVYTADLPSGHYALTLTGYTQNCVADSPVREVDVVAGGTGDVTFTVGCTTAAPAGAGHEIAFVTDRLPLDGQAPVRVYLMNEDGTGLRARTGVARDYLLGLDWLPDGRTLGFLSTPKFDDVIGGVISTMDAESGTIDTLFAVSALDSPEWSPDGTHMAFVDNFDVSGGDLDQVWVAGPDGSDRHQLTADGVPHWSPTWSPDGTQLAYATRSGEPDGLGNRIVVRSLGDPTETPVLADFRGDINRITWSPTGTTIAFFGSLDSNGSQIFTVPATGGEATQLTRGQGGNGGPAWSPDGQRIAFTSYRDGNSEIYVMNADGSNQTRLTNNPAQDLDPAWRP
jgi:hypothetical protein